MQSVVTINTFWLNAQKKFFLWNPSFHCADIFVPFQSLESADADPDKWTNLIWEISLRIQETGFHSFPSVSIVCGMRRVGQGFQIGIPSWLHKAPHLSGHLSRAGCHTRFGHMWLVWVCAGRRSRTTGANRPVLGLAPPPLHFSLNLPTFQQTQEKLEPSSIDSGQWRLDEILDEENEYFLMKGLSGHQLPFRWRNFLETDWIEVEK